MTHDDHRKLVQVVPNDLNKMWNEEALHILMIINLAFQIIFILTGSLRKYNQRTLYRMPLWCAYSLKTSVASTALGIIAHHALYDCGSFKKTELMSFWASFIFLHVCSTGTVTAYSSEDNELWFRRLGEQLVIPSGIAIYILLSSLPGCSYLPLLSILVYVAGFIKGFAFVRVLRLASKKHLQKQMHFHAGLRKIPVYRMNLQGRCEVILEGYNQFLTFKPLFVGLTATNEEDKGNRITRFRRLDSTNKAFAVVEIEHGFAYDTFYTNASSVYTFKGFICHATCDFLLFLVLVTFYFLCDMDDYRPIEVAITCLIFAVVVLNAFIAYITMLRSDWTDLWLSKYKKTRKILFFQFLQQPSKQTWSGSIPLLDLLSVGLEEKPTGFLKTQKLFGVDRYWEKHRYRTHSKVPADLKNLIFSHLWKLIDHSMDPKALSCVWKGSSLRKNGCDTLLWSIDNLELDQIVLTWHIATALCDSDVDNDQNIHRTGSTLISKYLLNLLVFNPDMLPVGNGMIRYYNTCAEITLIFKDKGPIPEKAEACRMLLEFDWSEVLASKEKGDTCKSVLFDGCKLSLALRNMGKESMWKIISEVWVDILAHAAAHCSGFHHSQQLRRGGEFLSHVWLMMENLGIKVLLGT